MKFCHTMIRVKNLEQSLDFYVNKLGMKVTSRKDYPLSDSPTDGFTLVFLSFSDSKDACDLELTYNWGENEYEHGNAFGHMAFYLGGELNATCEKLEENGVLFTKRPHEGRMRHIAFIKDPDGYSIELLSNG